MIDAQYFDKSGIDQKYINALQSKLFVKFCALEFSLENYIALFCVMAYRKKSGLERLIAFTEAFLQDDSPLQINTNGSKASAVKNSLVIGSETSEIVEKRIKNVLDPMLADIKINLNDTLSRYELQVNNRNVKYDFLYSKLNDKNIRLNMFAYRYKSKYKDFIKKISDIKSSDFKIKEGLDTLAMGGFPIKSMGLVGVVTGL